LTVDEWVKFQQTAERHTNKPFQNLNVEYFDNDGVRLIDSEEAYFAALDVAGQNQSTPA
jgi:hypothetical protein